MNTKEQLLYKQKSKNTCGEDSVKCKQAIEAAFIDLTKTICRVIEYRDSYTAGHQKRVAELALLVGKQAGLDKDSLYELYVGGMLHDIGKIGIPIDILTKTTRLTKCEFMLIKDHAEIGYNIIKETNFPWNIKDIVLNHHEKLDGSGYPNGLCEDDISMNVRIITICDVVEAMSTLRPYRAARARMEVMYEICAGRGVKYDIDIVDIMIDLLKTQAYNPWGENKLAVAEDKWSGYETRHKGGHSGL